MITIPADLKSPHTMLHQSKLFFAALLANILILACLPAKEVTLTSKDGKSGTFTLISLDNGSLTVSSANGKSYQLKLTDLDAASNQAVQAWIAEGGNLSRKIEIEYNSGKRASISKNEGYDDKAYVFNPEIILKNKSNTQETPPLRLTVALLGRPVGSLTNISVKWLELRDSPAISPMQESTAKFSTVNWEYDNRGTAQYGSRYLGYIAVVQTKSGEVLASRCVPEKTGERLMPYINKMLTNDNYDKNAQLIHEGTNYTFNGTRYPKGKGPRYAPTPAPNQQLTKAQKRAALLKKRKQMRQKKLNPWKQQLSSSV